MTLIITVLTWDKVIQVSDRRLFNTKTGATEDDHSNKMMSLSCKDASLIFSYTGLAMVGSPLGGTIDWLINSLNKMDAPALPIDAIRIRLSKEWKDIVFRTRVNRNLSKLTSSIVLAGFFRIGEPFALRIHSNKTDEFLQANIKKKKASYALLK